MKRGILGWVFVLVGGALMLCAGLAVPRLMELYGNLPTAVGQGLASILGVYWSWVQGSPWWAAFGLLGGIAIGLFINALMILKERRNHY